MPSAISHAVAAAGIGAWFNRPRLPRLVWGVGLALCVLPDIDVLGFGLGIRYGDPLGHRGLTHSIAFAAIAATVAAGLVPRSDGVPKRPILWSFFFLVTASHGVLDALTNGGLGVAFWAPFSNERSFFPWTPILVSPIGVRRFLSQRGLAVLRSEAAWVWIPSMALAGAAWFWRVGGRTTRRRQPNGA